MNLINESNDRPAWTQYENYPNHGMGSGLNSFKNKQPKNSDELPKKDYYVKTGGKA